LESSFEVTLVESLDKESHVIIGGTFIGVIFFILILFFFFIIIFLNMLGLESKI
jgi:hypothetical protein